MSAATAQVSVTSSKNLVDAATPAMRAVTYARYGSFDVLRLEQIARPVVADDQVLVRVHAAALHVGDVFSVKGEPYAMRFVTGLLKPKHGVPGFDLAGRVEAVGSKVTRFNVGHEVFGASGGTCAEYALATADQLALKPARLSFEQAAGLATSGVAAHHALSKVAKLQPGQKILINGAAGGVGTFAVQISKALGAEVTGVCSTRNVEMLRSLGADHVIDYTQRDFTHGPERYDVVLDNIENRSLSACRRALTPTGMLICNSGTGASGLAMYVRLLKPLLLSPFVRQQLRRYVTFPTHEDLRALAQLVESGAVTPVLDRTYTLAETAAALAYIDAGHARGKVVVKPSAAVSGAG